MSNFLLPRGPKSGGQITGRSGRKNWMFYGSDTHAESAAAIFSLIASCRLHRIDPQQYLDEILRVPVSCRTGRSILISSSLPSSGSRPEPSSVPTSSTRRSARSRSPRREPAPTLPRTSCALQHGLCAAVTVRREPDGRRGLPSPRVTRRRGTGPKRAMCRGRSQRCCVDLSEVPLRSSGLFAGFGQPCGNRDSFPRGLT